MVIGAGLTYFSIDTGKTWTPEATFDTLGVGSYLVMIQDSSRSCLDTINISLTAEDDEHDIVIDELLAPTCFGEEDGYLKLSLSPPSETVSWLWENGTTQPERTRLEAGKYEVRLSLNSF